MKKQLSALILALVMMLGLLSGCAPKPTATPTPTQAPGQDQTTPTDQPADGQAQEYAVILKTQAVDFWVKMKEGVEAKAEELGVKVDVYAAQSEEDTEGQLRILENALTKNYAAIGVAPLSPVNLIPGIVQANQKGIYVMNIDEKVDLNTLKEAGGSVIGFATTDNVAVGKKGAQAIMDKFPEGGKVAIIEGKAGNASGENRKLGATEAFKANDKFELVGSLPADWDRQKALDVATSFIQSTPDLVGIYCCNDGMALGALQAVVNADKLGKIAVVGTDGDTEARESVEQGLLTATVAQDPAMIGATSLEMMVKAVNEKMKIDPNTEPQILPVDSQLIVKED